MQLHKKNLKPSQIKSAISNTTIRLQMSKILSSKGASRDVLRTRFPEFLKWRRSQAPFCKEQTVIAGLLPASKPS